MTVALRRAAAVILARIRAGHDLEVGDLERDAAKAGVSPHELGVEVSVSYEEERRTLRRN